MKRQIIDTLRDIREGNLIDELDEGIAELILACNRTGKVGTMSVTIKVKPDLRLRTMVIEDNVKVTAPQDLKATMFHVTDDLTLSLRDPRQPDIPNLEPVGEVLAVESFEEVKKLESV